MNLDCHIKIKLGHKVSPGPLSGRDVQATRRRPWDGKPTLLLEGHALAALYMIRPGRACIDLPDPSARLRELPTCPFVLATNTNDMTIIDELHAPYQRYAVRCIDLLIPRKPAQLSVVSVHRSLTFPCFFSLFRTSPECPNRVAVTYHHLVGFDMPGPGHFL